MNPVKERLTNALAHTIVGRIDGTTITTAKGVAKAMPLYLVNMEDNERTDVDLHNDMLRLVVSMYRAGLAAGKRGEG